MKPLAGLRVLELARILAGPWVGQLMADLGADVVKVESPDGDDTRTWGPPFVAAAEGGDLSAAYFHCCNRGKRSIVADFRSEEGRALVRRLAAHADVLVENFKCGGLAKYGLDWESLRAACPRLVYCSITGFGQTGPYADRAGYDFLIQGMAGAMDITGSPDGPPLKAGYATADILTGLYASVGILAALRRRDATGTGAHLDLALMDSQVAALANQPLNYLVSGTSPRRLGNAHPNIVPYEVFPAADGAVVIATGNDRQFRDLCEAIGAAELAAEADYRSNGDRVRNRARLVPALAGYTSRWARADLLARLDARKVPAGPVNSLADVFADPQVLARGLKIDLPSDAAKGGTIPSVRSPIVIDGEAMASPRASPRLGADGDDILNDPNWGA
jgi:glutaryl-CoA transferase